MNGAETNHTALGRGIKLYTDAMRRLVKERLTAAFKSGWWEYGVLDAVTTPQRTSLSRELDRNPGVDRADLLDAHHFVRVVTKNFDRAFEDVYHNFKQTQSWLLQVGETRNIWAHHSERGHARRRGRPCPVRHGQAAESGPSFRRPGRSRRYAGRS